jgi:hypothetical protein
MTTLARYDDPFRDKAVFTVNGCLAAVITPHDARELPSLALFPQLVIERVAPLVWLAMPCHDGDRP